MVPLLGCHLAGIDLRPHLFGRRNAADPGGLMRGWTTPPANGQHLAVHIGRLPREQ